MVPGLLPFRNLIRYVCSGTPAGCCGSRDPGGSSGRLSRHPQIPYKFTGGDTYDQQPEACFTRRGCGGCGTYDDAREELPKRRMTRRGRPRGRHRIPPPDRCGQGRISVEDHLVAGHQRRPARGTTQARGFGVATQIVPPLSSDLSSCHKPDYSHPGTQRPYSKLRIRRCQYRLSD